MSFRKFRLVLKCVKLIVEIARQLLALWNMAFNYSSVRYRAHACKVVQPI